MFSPIGPLTFSYAIPITEEKPIFLKNLDFKLEHLFNEKKIILFIYIFLINSNSHSDIVYLDVQYIVDNSNLGKFYKNKIKSSEDNALKKLKDKETIISKKENEILKIKKIF